MHHLPSHQISGYGMVLTSSLLTLSFARCEWFDNEMVKSDPYLGGTAQLLAPLLWLCLWMILSLILLWLATFTLSHSCEE